MSVTISNVEARVSRTFQIPGRSERSALQVGDYAKLIFVGEEGGERMWVRVTETVGGYAGTLANEPATIEGLTIGDRVAFGPEHVADIAREAGN